jgi:hypothetical protein
MSNIRKNMIGGGLVALTLGLSLNPTYSQETFSLESKPDEFIEATYILECNGEQRVDILEQYLDKIEERLDLSEENIKNDIISYINGEESFNGAINIGSFYPVVINLNGVEGEKFYIATKPKGYSNCNDN